MSRATGQTRPLVLQRACRPVRGPTGPLRSGPRPSRQHNRSRIEQPRYRPRALTGRALARQLLRGGPVRGRTTTHQPDSSNQPQHHAASSSPSPAPQHGRGPRTGRRPDHQRRAPLSRGPVRVRQRRNPHRPGGVDGRRRQTPPRTDRRCEPRDHGSGRPAAPIVKSDERPRRTPWWYPRPRRHEVRQ